MLLFSVLFCAAQSKNDTIIFAYISDTHIGSGSGQADLEKCIADMNTRPEIQFVIHAGDVTEFGADSEIETAKNVMDRLSKPYYIPATTMPNGAKAGATRSTKYSAVRISHSRKAVYCSAAQVPDLTCAWVWHRFRARAWYGSIR